MLLSLARLSGIGPFDDLAISFCDDDGAPRKLTVLFGGEGVGKTSILAALASTRPGHAVAQMVNQRGSSSSGPQPYAVADWVLSDDDPARPHPLRVASPTASLEEREDAATLRRREQALFDRKATEGGYVLVTFSGARWFSRTPVLLTTPERTILRYDVRATASFEDATRADLTRETKQVLSFIGVASALSRSAGGEATSGTAPRFAGLDHRLREVLDVLLPAAGCSYVGVDPVRLEPLFETSEGRVVELDDLPKSARHLTAFGALTMRALAAAYPGKDVREAEGVVLIDDAEVHLELHLQRALGALLRKALPKVQWILTTSSPAVTLGCDTQEVLALRRAPASGRVELFEGPLAVVH
ncbi:MAG TPA: hypothetical protein VE093_35665 [Polyangiaceae bacterium]|jgi:predicted ATPase|nr:hypothetical protein [Polyangiaceae bacterium]